MDKAGARYEFRIFAHDFGILETRNQLHLNDYENVNYLLAIKRIIGMAPLPDRMFYCTN